VSKKVTPPSTPAAASSSKKTGVKTKTKGKPKTGTKTKTTLPTVLSCGVLVVQRAPVGAVLALLRADGSPDLPKGHVKRGESDVDAALRELLEETGIAPRLVRLDPTFVYESSYRTRSKRTRQPVMKTVRLFLGEVDGPIIVTVSDHIDYAWLRTDDDVALDRDIGDNPTFLGALRAWRVHEALATQLPG
jgi:8-oxo-dGTP pyrophosphatase MutT (NUDIX family)